MPAIESAIASVPAKVGVAAIHFETREELRHRADQVFFAASTFKPTFPRSAAWVRRNPVRVLPI